jgi:hypothetical protein
MDDDGFDLDSLLELERDNAHYAQLLDPLNHAAGWRATGWAIGRGSRAPHHVMPLPRRADRDIERFMQEAPDDDDGGDGAGKGGAGVC